MSPCRGVVTTFGISFFSKARIFVSFKSLCAGCLFFAVLGLSFTPPAAAQSAAFVRSAVNFGESVRYTMSIAPAAGDFLGVFVWQTEGAATPSAMTDNLGNLYSKACDLTYVQVSGARRLTVYH